ncbi:MAG: hypothetical protein LBO75_03265, partial [Bifidobacteriaceae bacterium]|nr:hypothetical protein [Bifidobacteriaceae bacterium]
MRRTAAGVAGSAALIAAITTLARIVGFARWGVFSAAVGSTAVGSAYAAANALPNVLFEVAAGGALAAVAVPLLALPLAERLQEQASQTVSALVTWALLVLIPLGALLAWAAAPIASWLLEGDLEAAHPGTLR